LRTRGIEVVMRREAIGPYILSWPNLLISVEFIFSKGYSKSQVIRVTHRQKVRRGDIKYFLCKGLFGISDDKINEGLRSHYFFHTFA
jgi:hypothetical protein